MMNATPVANIQVIKGSNGYRIYGRMGAVMDADINKNITYCNINIDAAEYKRMKRALMKE